MRCLINAPIHALLGGSGGGLHTLTTEAVSPAAEEDLPEVYTARGRKLATYLSNCDLAHEGSPTMATLMSPLRLIPCTGTAALPGRGSGQQAARLPRLPDECPIRMQPMVYAN